MKIKEKLLISAIGLSTILTITSPIKSNAALQANGNTSKTDTIGNWLLNVRKMEETGGTLGLTDTINTTDLTSSSTKSNNLDIHMEKNTEYGAMAILSASAYGNQNVIADGETTTGNKSGVYIKLNNEWVAAGGLQVLKDAHSKYNNSYTVTYATKIGDAITETAGWHGGTSEWLKTEGLNGLIRACSGSLFSYSGYGNTGGGNGSELTYISKPWHTRAVIVVGNGF